MYALFLAVALAAPPEKPPATLDEKIAAALKTHPDIKAAEAKRMLAEAELEQARLAITQKVSAAVSKVELAKAKLMQAEEEVAIAEKVFQMGTAASGLEKAQFMKAKPVLIGAKAELAAAELELQQLVGKGGAEAKPKPADKSEGVKAEAYNPKMPSGPMIEKLEAAVFIGCKLDFKDIEVKKAFEGLMTAAKLDDLPVRGLKMLGGDMLKSPPKFDSLSGLNSFDGWVELFVDELNANQSGLPEQFQGKYDVYVREYGLLVERAANAPKDAMTLTEFARVVRAKRK